MVGNPLVQCSATSAGLSSRFINRYCLSSSLPCLPSKSQKHVVFIKAISGNNEQDQPLSSSRAKNHLSVVLDVPRSIWKHTLYPLSDFGFGRKSIWEGGVGLFLLSGVVLVALSLAWLKGFQIHSKFRKYLAVFEFPHACGICIGTPVRIRGVNVGKVIRLDPSFRNVEAVVEVANDKTIIPRSSLVEVNQSGLLMETIIDVTPRNLIRMPSVGPLDPECDKEGYIVCDRQKIKGRQGVSLDALVGTFTRIGREMEAVDVVDIYSQAKRVADVIEEARSLLSKIEAMSGDIQPLLSEVRDTGLLKKAEFLTESLTLATENLRKLHLSTTAPDSTCSIQKSLYTLMSTLENIESISSDISGFTSDEATKRNLKLLIKSLSRLL